MRSTDFMKCLTDAVESDGKQHLPGVQEIEDANAALRAITLAKFQFNMSPYSFLIDEGVTCWYPKIFLNGDGMGGAFNGTGVILALVNGRPRAFSFTMCEHEWDESGANHMRGWHPKRCHKCGFDASIDSGD